MAGSNPRLGITYKVSAVAGFTLMSALVKLAAETVPTVEVCFFRSFFALLTIVAVLAWRGEFPAAIYTANPWGHVWRGATALVSMICNFTALACLPLADAIALGYASPLFLTIFAAVLLGEVVRRFRWNAVAIGLVGVLIILWPRLDVLKTGLGSEVEALGAASALVGAATGALGAILASRLVIGERTSTIVFYFSALCTIGFLLTAPFGWVVPDASTCVVLVVIGVLGGLAQLALTESYRHAETSTVAPFEYTSILFSLALGWLVFSQLPTATMLVGSTIVIAASLYVIWREHQLQMRPAPLDNWPWILSRTDEHDAR